jgi:hypothetical protein
VKDVDYFRIFVQRFDEQSPSESPEYQRQHGKTQRQGNPPVIGLSNLQHHFVQVDTPECKKKQNKTHQQKKQEL